MWRCVTSTTQSGEKVSGGLPGGPAFLSVAILGGGTWWAALRHFRPVHINAGLKSMSEDRSSDVEVFVHKKLVVSFRCPACGLEKSINADRIKDVSHWQVNATCRRCAHKFKVSFNFRQFYRKDTSLHGLLFSSFETLEPMGGVHITDLSLSGMGFESERPLLKAGDVAVVRFLLDDEDESPVEKEIGVISVRDSKVGAVFLDTSGYDVALGKYIMP
jgi:predicted RNA-binding Zn-ribbon protein involved in translation (DUF1610 family)